VEYHCLCNALVNTKRKKGKTDCLSVMLAERVITAIAVNVVEEKRHVFFDRPSFRTRSHQCMRVSDKRVTTSVRVKRNANAFLHAVSAQKL
jgi:hypothetical protein